MSKVKNTGCFLVSWSMDAPGKEVLIVATKDMLGTPLIINSFSGVNALTMFHKLKGNHYTQASEISQIGWRSLSGFVAIDDLPEIDVEILVRRYDKRIESYVSPIITKMTIFGWAFPPETEEVVYDAWMELPANTEEDLIK